jgi:hypothetical protein
MGNPAAFVMVFPGFTSLVNVAGGSKRRGTRDYLCYNFCKDLSKSLYNFKNIPVIYIIYRVFYSTVVKKLIIASSVKKHS